MMRVEIWILVGAWLAAIGSLLAVTHLRVWWFAQQKTRVPVAEKLLRGPGESLRKKLENLEEALSSEITVAFVLPLIYAGTILLEERELMLIPNSFWVLGSVGVAAYVLIGYRIHRLIVTRRDYRLGLSGERAVGEEVNQLMLQGCHVFHDVPNLPYGNIDHVLVAPSGVYAVETKARRKKESAGKESHKVIFDGTSVQFAGRGPESKCLDQAKQQASRLSDSLSKATGEAVAVQAVLALPGWFVECKGRGDVIVVSGRAVNVLPKGRAVLDDPSISRIVHQLDQRCRDVEF